MIRECSEDDFPAILEIYDSSKLDELANEDDDFALLPLMEDEQRLKKISESVILVFDENGVKGFGAFYENEVRGLFVAPRFRGYGIGRALLEHILGRIESDALLYVTKSNHRVKALYEQYGFRVSSEFRTNYNGKSVLANEMRQGNSS